MAQWSLLVGQGRRKHRTNWYTMFTTVRIFFYGSTDGRPLCIHSAITAMRVPSSCLLWATREQPTSSATFVRQFWTYSRRPCRPWWGLNVLYATRERPRPPLCLQWRPGRFCCRIREAQRSQPLCKGVIATNQQKISSFVVGRSKCRIRFILLYKVS